MIRRQHVAASQAGFTIIELMIATVVLAMILVTVTTLMINIGNLFYKEVNLSRIQNTTRAIADDVSNNLKATSANSVPVTGSPQSGPGATTMLAECFDNERYSYVVGNQVGTNTYAHVLWRDDYSASSVVAYGCPPVNLTYAKPPSSGPNGVELVSPNSELTAFSIAPAGGGYQIQVGVAYGDKADLNNPTSINATCISGPGDQFCATASLTTFVTPRL